MQVLVQFFMQIQPGMGSSVSKEKLYITHHLLKSSKALDPKVVSAVNFLRDETFVVAFATIN